MKTAIIGFVSALQLAAVTEARAATRYVKAGATGTGTGGWSNASPNLQAMINASASTDQVWVAKGTYLASSAPDSTFKLVNHVSVIGGFNAASTSDTTRDPNPASVTILTGAYVGGNVQTVITGNTTLAANDTILDGFAITGGASSSTNGCGIRLTNGASPTIQFCRIVANLGSGLSQGGGLYCDGTSAPTLDWCTFESNSAGSGGAIYCASSAVMQNCTFENNSQSGTTAGGGALLVGGSGAPSITACNFASNISVAADGGGAIVNVSTGTWNVVRCAFTANESRSSGASGGGGAVASLLGNLTLRDCLFVRNAAFRNGGAVRSRSGASTTLYSCTLYANRALFGAGGGVRIESGSTATVRNSIVWSCTGNDTGTVNQQISKAGSANISYCSIEGCSSCFDGNNLGTPPDFVAEAADNYRIRQASPCVNSGDNSTFTSGELDLDGHGRKDAANNIIDRSAYEWHGSASDCL